MEGENNMIKLTINMSERVAKEIEQTIGMKKMTGSFYGVTDEFLMKVTQAIQNKQETIELFLKDEKGEII